jgi:hypothetical protein
MAPEHVDIKRIPITAQNVEDWTFGLKFLLSRPDPTDIFALAYILYKVSIRKSQFVENIKTLNVS